MPRLSKSDAPADLHEQVDRVNAPAEFQEAFLPPVSRTLNVRVNTSKPVAGRGSRFEATLDLDRDVMTIPIGKELVECSIHSLLILNWVRAK